MLRHTSTSSVTTTGLAKVHLLSAKTKVNYRWGALTLFFVYLPGFVISVGFVYWGFTALRASKNEEEEPQRKPVTCKRFWRYMGVLFVFPLLYPVLQVLL